MLNRFVIFTLLVFSSVAIPKQTETNYQTRSIQSIEPCGEREASSVTSTEIKNKNIEDQILNVSCKN